MLPLKQNIKIFLVLMLASILTLTGCASGQPVSVKNPELNARVPLGPSFQERMQNFLQGKLPEQTRYEKVFENVTATRTQLLNKVFPMNDLVTKEEWNKQVQHNKDNDWPDLDLQHRAFALHYVTHYDHRLAAQEAGLKKENGLKILRLPLVSAFVAHMQETTFRANIITEDFVRAQWLNLLPKLMGEEAVAQVTGTGEEFTAPRFYPGEATNLLKEMAKTTKIYESGSGQGGQVNVQINLAALLGNESDVIDVTPSDDESA